MAHDAASGPHHPATGARLTSAPARPDESVPVWDWTRLLVAALTRAASEVRGAAVVPDVGRSSADTFVGVAAVSTSAVVAAGRMAGRAARPVGRLLLEPPLISRSWTPAAQVQRLADLGRRERVRGSVDLEAILRRLLPRVVAAVLDQLDLTDLVVERVDLDAVVATVDLDAAVGRVDIEGIVARLDLDEIVARVDLDAVAARIDVDAVAARLDIDGFISRVDLIGLAEYVVEGIDLPEIIRDSTGSIASEAVRGVRMQSFEADAQVSKLIDRLVRRGRARRTEGPTDGVPEPRPVPDLPEPS